MSRDLRAAVEVVLRDLQRPVPLDLTIDVGEEDDGLIVMFGERGHGAAGVWVARGESGARLLVRLAGQMQDFFHESAGAWGEARPPCPGHSHPARPEVLDGGAWWTCPADGRRIARVGALPCPPRRLACRAWSGSRS